MNLRGLFEVATDGRVSRGDRCVIDSPRGPEIGTVLLKPTLVGPEGWSEGQVAHDRPVGRLLRQLNREDQRWVRELESRDLDEDLAFCREQVRAHELPMKIAGVEFLLGGEKVLFYFVSEGRVDFRGLVKDLARHFRARIELKQIGARDEARLLGDMNAWGRELCCRAFLGELQPVTMKMAKNQNMPLDPARISGVCGKLKCCLRYEDAVYTQLRAELPRRGVRVRFSKGVGRVIGQEVLLEAVQVELESGEREIAPMSQFLEIDIDPKTGKGTLTDAGLEEQRALKEAEREAREAKLAEEAERSARRGAGDGRTRRRRRPASSEDRPASSGDRARSSGDRARSSGDRVRSSGDRARSSGDRARSSGDRARSSGDRARSSEDRARSVEEPAKPPEVEARKPRREGRRRRRRPPTGVEGPPGTAADSKAGATEREDRPRGTPETGDTPSGLARKRRRRGRREGDSTDRPEKRESEGRGQAGAPKPPSGEKKGTAEEGTVRPGRRRRRARGGSQSPAAGEGDRPRKEGNSGPESPGKGSPGSEEKPPPSGAPRPAPTRGDRDDQTEDAPGP